METKTWTDPETGLTHTAILQDADWKGPVEREVETREKELKNALGGILPTTFGRLDVAESMGQIVKVPHRDGTRSYRRP